MRRALLGSLGANDRWRDPPQIRIERRSPSSFVSTEAAVLNAERLRSGLRNARDFRARTAFDRNGSVMWRLAAFEVSTLRMSTRSRISSPSDTELTAA